MNANIIAIIQAIPESFIKQVGAHNRVVCSDRSVRFDMPDGCLHGINRIKVTRQGSKFMVRFYKIVEVEMVYDLTEATLLPAICRVTGLAL